MSKEMKNNETNHTVEFAEKYFEFLTDKEVEQLRIKLPRKVLKQLLVELKKDNQYCVSLPDAVKRAVIMYVLPKNGENLH